jgi:acetyl-CoA acetyltransferase
MPFGYWGPPAQMALIYNEYLQRYGATRESMATLVVQLRRNAQRIESAYWHGKPLTVDEYLASRILADPVCVLDCDIPVDCVTAFVLTRADRAPDSPHKPVYIAAAERAQPNRPQFLFFNVLEDVMAGGRALAARLQSSCGLRASDIDVPELYDGFTPLVYFWLECLGFCPEGEAHRFIQGGAIDPEGRFPLIGGGGSIGNGRLHGAAQMLECYLQLSRRAGARQLAKADTAIACHSFPNLGAAAVYSAERIS